MTKKGSSEFLADEIKKFGGTARRKSVTSETFSSESNPSLQIPAYNTGARISRMLAKPIESHLYSTRRVPFKH